MHADVTSGPLATSNVAFREAWRGRSLVHLPSSTLTTANTTNLKSSRGFTQHRRLLHFIKTNKFQYVAIYMNII